MKRILLLIGLFALTAQSISAQKLEESKFWDNWWIGGFGGINMPTSSYSTDITANWQLGIRGGRWFTPYFGLGAQAEILMGGTGHLSVSRTIVNATNLSLLGMFNLQNLFMGYKGTPRKFETTAVLGIGAARLYGVGWKYNPTPDSQTATVAMDFAFNLGSKRQWQFFIEPHLLYELANEGKNVQFNINRAMFRVNVGLTYYFRNSNGTHNFKLYEVPEFPDVDALNDNINNLRISAEEKDKLLAEKDAQLADKDAEIAGLQLHINNQVVQNVYITNLQPTVIFRQGKKVIDPAQFAPIEQIAKYMRENPESKITIRGYASPEGIEAQNQKLSEDRATVVKNALIRKYGIEADRLTAIGMGITDEIFNEIELNRVVTFNDDSKE